MHQKQQCQNYDQNIEIDISDKVANTMPVTYGDILKNISKLITAGAVGMGALGLGFLAYWFKGSSDSNNALATKREGAGLVSADKVEKSSALPYSFARNPFGTIFENPKQVAQSSKWISGVGELKKEKTLPKLNIVSNKAQREISNSATESPAKLPAIIKNELAVAVNASVVVTSQNLNAYKHGTAPANLKFEVSEKQHGQFKLVSDESAIDSFTLQDVFDGKIKFCTDGELIEPSYKIKVIDITDQMASDAEWAQITFFEKQPVRVGEVLQVSDYPITKSLGKGPSSNGENYAIKQLLPSNNIFVTYGATRGNNSYYQIRGRFLYPNGTLCGSEFAINSGDKNFYLGPNALGSFSDGKPILTFSRNDGEKINNYYEIFEAASGCDPFSLHTNITEVNAHKNSVIQFYPGVIVLKNATEINQQFIIVWNSGSLISPWQTNVFAKKFDKNSGAIGDEIKLNNKTLTDEFFPLGSAFTFNNNGKIFFTWNHVETDRTTILATITNNNITTLISEFRISHDPREQWVNSIYKDPDSEENMLTTDNYICNSSCDCQCDVSLQKIYKNGTYSSPIQVTNATAHQCYLYSWVTALKDSSLGDKDRKTVVVYTTTEDLCYGKNDIGIKVLNADGTEYGKELKEIFTGYKQVASYVLSIKEKDGKFLVTAAVKENQKDTGWYIYSQFFALHNECPRLITPPNIPVSGENENITLSKENFNAIDRELRNVKYYVTAADGGRFLDGNKEVANFTQHDINAGRITFQVFSPNVSFTFWLSDGRLRTSTFHFNNVTASSIKSNKLGIYLGIVFGVVGIATLASIYGFRKCKKNREETGYVCTDRESKVIEDLFSQWKWGQV